MPHVRLPQVGPHLDTPELRLDYSLATATHTKTNFLDLDYFLT